YQSARGAHGPLRVGVWLPPLGASRPAFVSTLNRRLLPVIDDYGRMLTWPEDAQDVWPLFLRVKSVLREHITRRRLRIDCGLFVAEATYPRPRFDLLAAVAPPAAPSVAEPAPEPDHGGG
ncbi:MAG: hypothetical protein ACK4XK_13695, partial [Casimicrobiaceae bacterium]